MDRTPDIFLPVDEFEFDEPQWVSGKPGIFVLEKRLAITLDDVVYIDREGKKWTVPRGFPTDGMSYPWIVEWMWNRFDPDNLRSGVTHDYAYTLHDYFDDWPVTREEADQNLFDGLALDDGGWKWAKYAAVRACGWWLWNRRDHNELTLQWVEMVQAGPVALDAWIEAIKNGKRYK